MNWHGYKRKKKSPSCSWQARSLLKEHRKHRYTCGYKENPLRSHFPFLGLESLYTLQEQGQTSINIALVGGLIYISRNKHVFFISLEARTEVGRAWDKGKCNSSFYTEWRLASKIVSHGKRWKILHTHFDSIKWMNLWTGGWINEFFDTSAT